MLAKKKPIEHITLNDLGISIKPSTRLIKAIDGEIKKNCVMLNETKQILKILNEVA